MKYFQKIRLAARAINSDGCTGVPDFYLIVCLRHDVHYSTGKTIGGDPITRDWADRHFRSGIRHLSILHKWSPMAAWRYAAVRKMGKKHWKSNSEVK